MHAWCFCGSAISMTDEQPWNAMSIWTPHCAQTRDQYGMNFFTFDTIFCRPEKRTRMSRVITVSHEPGFSFRSSATDCKPIRVWRCLLRERRCLRRHTANYPGWMQRWGGLRPVLCNAIHEKSFWRVFGAADRPTDVQYSTYCTVLAYSTGKQLVCQTTFCLILIWEFRPPDHMQYQLCQSSAYSSIFGHLVEQWRSTKSHTWFATLHCTVLSIRWLKVGPFMPRRASDSRNLLLILKRRIVHLLESIMRQKDLPKMLGPN